MYQLKLSKKAHELVHESWKEKFVQGFAELLKEKVMAKVFCAQRTCFLTNEDIFAFLFLLLHQLVYGLLQTGNLEHCSGCF